LQVAGPGRAHGRRDYISPLESNQDRPLEQAAKAQSGNATESENAYPAFAAASAESALPLCLCVPCGCLLARAIKNQKI